MKLTDKINSIQYNKMAFLNLIRFVLAISIVLWHISFGFYEYNSKWSNNFIAGFRDITIYGGNQAFMLISGMVFYLAYYNRLDESLSIKDFLIGRAKKLYPATILVCVLVYIMNLIAHFTYNPDAQINLILLLEDCFFFGARLFGGEYGNYVGPIWFLSILVLAYLISCFIIIVTRKRKSVYWFLIPLVCTFIIGNGGDQIVPILNLNRYGSELFDFFLGFFFMIFLLKFDNFKISTKIFLRLLGFTISILFLYCFYVNKGNNPLGRGEMVGALFCFIPLFTALYGLKLNILFDNKFFKVLSGSTFYIYLWHMPLKITIEVIDHFNNNFDFKFEGIKNMLIFFAILLVISIVHYYVEKYIFKRLKEKFEKRNYCN